MRLKTIQNIMEKNFDTIPFEGILREVFGQPEANGLWLIYGAEKHGKTTLSLILANELSKYKKAAFIMAEQGFDKDFQDVLKRLSFGANNPNLLFDEYVPVSDLENDLKKRRAPDVVFLDNLTIYQDELKNGQLRKILKTHQNKLFIMLAHEEKGEPYGATAKLARKLAKRVIRVEGMKAIVTGRSKGGQLMIDEEKAALYWGTYENETED